MNIVDFITDPDYCRLLINEWVSDQTEEKIQDLLPPGSIKSTARLVLTNAIYFKANWFKPFEEADTIDGPFFPSNGSTSTVPMMNQVLITLYAEAPGEYQAVKLAYQGTKRNSMVIIMPEQGSFESFENSLSLSTFNEIIRGMIDYQVTLSLPKFDFDWDSSLVSALQSLGMEDAFMDTRADFSGINGQQDGLYIHDVFHKAFIAVDEIGTEAAAATAVIAGYFLSPPKAVMTINRPFIFAIYNDDTGVILFLGRMVGL